MSAAQHTPGPWTFGGNEVDWFAEPDGAFNSISSQPIGAPNRSDPVCVVTQRDHKGYRSDDIQLEANARLIAAAPDMLAALRKASDLADVACGMTGCRSDDEFVWSIRDAIREAIAKAEGQS